MASQTRQFLEANLAAKIRQPDDQVHGVLPNVPDLVQQQKPQPSAPPMPNSNDDQTMASCYSVFRNIADACKDMFSLIVETVLSRFLTVHKRDKRGVICWILLGITFARFVAGAVKLLSDCDKEQKVGIYLFFKGVLGLIFWITFLVVRRLMEKGTDLKDNLFVTVYICVDSLFGFGWYIAGIVWVFGNFSSMMSACPASVNDWDIVFITVAVVLTAVDLVVFALFMIYVLCKRLCPDPEQTPMTTVMAT